MKVLKYDYTYWMTDDSWTKTDKTDILLTDKAPAKAKESFERWKKNKRK